MIIDVKGFTKEAAFIDKVLAQFRPEDEGVEELADKRQKELEKGLEDVDLSTETEEFERTITRQLGDPDVTVKLFADPTEFDDLVETFHNAMNDTSYKTLNTRRSTPYGKLYVELDISLDGGTEEIKHFVDLVQSRLEELIDIEFESSDPKLWYLQD
jgi:hypothetical protein